MSKTLKRLLGIGLVVMFGMGILVPLVAAPTLMGSFNDEQIDVTDGEDSLWGIPDPPPPDTQPEVPPQT